AALVVAPRLPYRLAGGALRPPVGADVWADTSLRLPAGLNAARYRNLYTGALLTPVEQEGTLRLRLADVLADFPVALLTPVEMPDE
ncbi:MAG: hypothetical protein DCC57_23750, partial [Chloroflexi bacterium]